MPSCILTPKKIAAGFAILIGFYYLMISGAAVSTQRAFIMVSIVMLGVFFDRRALSLHSVALAALVILAWRPEDVSSAGFQMSFAATIDCAGYGVSAHSCSAGVFALAPDAGDFARFVLIGGGLGHGAFFGGAF